MEPAPGPWVGNVKGERDVTQPDDRFTHAIEAIDEVNRRDPRKDSVKGTSQPRELAFSKRVYAWVERLLSSPSEAVLLAARAHTLRRWDIPRDRYPMDTAGYHKWREALAVYHAEQARKILAEVGYADDVIRKVEALITKANWPQDAEAQALEDADCLVFLETKLHGYIGEWDDAKTVRILIGTLGKMTPRARELAKKLDLGAPERALLGQATEAWAAGKR